MERLTEKAWRNLDPWECCGQDNYCKRGCHDEGGCYKGCIVPKIYDKLARYEDAEEQGRLIVLPCKVGDTFFAVAYSSEPRVITARVYQLSFDGEETTIWVENVEDTKDWWKVSLKMFLKWCHFSTSEEAEKALEGIKCLK